MDSWQIKKQEYLEKNSWIALRKDTCITPSGKIIPDYYVLEMQDVSCVIALTVDHKIVFIEEYKHGVQKKILQIPCGYIENGENPDETAKRELLEETGYSAKSTKEWFYLGSFSGSPGRLTHYYHFFLALDCEKVQEPQQDEIEDVHPFLCSFAEAEKLVLQKNTDLVTPLGLSLAKNFLKQKELT